MAPPPKGKVPTKGSKQIITENTATVFFYRNMSLVSAIVYHSVTIMFFFSNISTGTIILNLIVSILYIGCHQVMAHISRPRYNSSGQIVDTGVDLNMEGGIGEHLKDIVILTSITHNLALLSDYFWFCLLLLPMRAFWLVWINFIGPWFFQQAPDETEQDEKKRKKIERRMRRFQM